MRGAARLTWWIAGLAVTGCADREQVPTAASDPRPGATAAAVGERPNILVIITDNQDKASMAFMPITRSLVGQNGVEFTEAFVSYPLCCPARATFLSGQYAHNHGVLDNSPPAGGYARFDHTQSLPVWLQAAGYYTAHIGKYLNGYGREDSNRGDRIPACREIPPGWSEWYGMVQNENNDYYDFVLNENGTLNAFGSPRGLPRSCTTTPQAATYQTDLYAARAVDFIQRRAVASDGMPFYLWISIGAPHGQNEAGGRGPEPAPRHTGLFASEPLPQPPSFNEADVSDKPSYFQSLPLLNGARIANLTTEYRRRLEALQSVDEAVRDLVDALEATAQLANTVVIFTSDQGQMRGEHRLYTLGLGYVYDESIRVPLFIRGPGAPAGQTRGQLVVNPDLTATILELAGAIPTRVLDGQSLVALFGDPAAPWRTAFPVEAYLSDGRNYSGVRTGNQLYAVHDTGEEELYDLALDPYQLQSRHGDLAYIGTKAALQLLHDALRECAGSSCWR